MNLYEKIKFFETILAGDLAADPGAGLHDFRSLP
jgi:hypothetical protein